MSQSCPLCGKAKPDDALFCEACDRRLRTDYEVKVPENELPAPEPNVKKQPVRTERAEENPIETTTPAGTTSFEAVQMEKKKKWRAPLLFLLVIVLLGGGFFVYNETVRKQNLERSGWETALKLNSVPGYIAYMEQFPQGAHAMEAQEGLLRLKSEEADMWERMKQSANSSELRDFLTRHPESPYTPLVQKRLDSLSWMGALGVNTLQSYTEYIMQSQRGELLGEYSAEARKRQGMLEQTSPVDTEVLNNIRNTISGFFASLSGSNHAGAYQYLAPIVQRFFNSGAASRERITGELLMTRTRAQGATLWFAPDLEGIQYTRSTNGHYQVNMPLTKSFDSGNGTEQVPGYIVHIELNTEFEISSIHETKPHPQAP